MSHVKFFVMFSMLALITMGCTEDPNVFVVPKGHSYTMITSAEAIDLAIEAAEMFADETSRASVRSISGAENVVMIKNADSRGGEQLIYAVNYDNNKGYALIACKKIDNPILAFIEKGNYVSTSSYLESGISIFMDNALGYLCSFEGDIESVCDNSRALPYEAEVKIPVNGPIVPVQWGQENFYAQYCPDKKATGCFATALAQILCGLKKPLSFIRTYDNTHNDVALEWDKIKWHANPETPTDNIGADNCNILVCTVKSNEAIQHLMAEIGYRGGTIYKPEGSSTNVEKMPEVAESFGLICYDDKSFNYKYVIDALNQRHPLAMYGVNQYTDKWHIWICDAFRTRNASSVTFAGNYKDRYYHMNWGHAGQDDGYFQERYFAPDSTTKYSDIRYYEIARDTISHTIGRQ